MDRDETRLGRAWAIIAILTVASVAAKLAGAHWEGGGTWAGVIAMAAAFVKARQVLDHFLDLRRAGSSWRTFFTLALLAIAGGVVLISALGSLNTV